LGTYTPAAGVTPATGALSGFTNSFALPNNVKITGLEAEFGFRPSDRFNIGGNITYTKSSIKNGRVPCVDLNNDGFQDTAAVVAADVPLLVAQAGAGLVDTCAVSRASPAARFSGSFQSEYNMPIGDNAEGYLRGLLSYNGSTPGDDVNPVDSVGSYSLLNAYLGVRDPDGGWDLSVFARNLMNERKVLGRQGSRATSTINSFSYTSDYYIISSTSPREFGISLRMAFGSR
jgi:iron complex outermembrane recepter protein